MDSRSPEGFNRPRTVYFLQQLEVLLRWRINVNELEGLEVGGHIGKVDGALSVNI